MITFVSAYLGQPANTGIILYTCPANTVARVVNCTITNDATTTDTVTFHKVPSGDSSGDDNMIMNAHPVGGKETYPCIDEVVGKILEAGDSIKCTPATSNQLTVNLDVVEII